MKMKRKVISITAAISIFAVVAFTGFNMVRHKEKISSKKNEQSIKVDNIAENKVAQMEKNLTTSGYLNSKDKSSKSVNKENPKKRDEVKKQVVGQSVTEQTGVQPDNRGYSMNNFSEKVEESTENLRDQKEVEIVQQKPSKPTTPKPTTSKPQTESQNSNVTSNTDDVNVSGLATLPNKYNISVSSSQEQIVLDLLNEKRRQAGLKELIMDNTLVKVARYKSNHMIQYDYFNHASPQGEMWYDWLSKIGYNHGGTAENIAYNYSGAKDLFNQWWNSQGHRANMMNPTYTKVGIGVVYNKDKEIYMGTQTFSN